MKIVHVLFALCTGGSEHMLADIMAEQVNAGHQVSLVIINDLYEPQLYEKIDRSGVGIHVVGRPVGARNPLWYWRYNRLLRRLRPDVIHFHQRNTPIVTLPCRKAKRVITVHATNIDFPFWLKAHRWCAISDAVRQDVKNRLGRKAVTIMNGIRTADVLGAKRPIDHLEGCLRMVMVSRLVHMTKGHDLLLQAMRRAIDSGRLPVGLSVDFVGEGPSEGYLRELAHQLGLDANVRFLGNRERTWVYSHLADYHLLVQPSRFEGFGLTVAEGMAAKVPVLVSDCEGPLEVVDGGRYGDVFRNGDAESLAEAIISVAQDYPRRSERAHTEAYRHAVECFDVAATARKYLEIYSR